MNEIAYCGEYWLILLVRWCGMFEFDMESIEKLSDKTESSRSSETDLLDECLGDSSGLCFLIEGLRLW